MKLRFFSNTGRNIPLTATPTTTTLTFEWPGQPGAIVYEITLQSTDGSPSPVPQTLPASQTSATFSGLVPGATYRVSLETTADGVDYPLSDDFATTILRKCMGESPPPPLSPLL